MPNDNIENEKKKPTTIQIVTGNCLDLIPLEKQSFDFCFADPPFNINQNYAGYLDRVQHDQYLDFTRSWIELACGKCSGAIALHGPDDLAEIYLEAGRDLGLKRVAWVQWHYRFGMFRRTNWIDSRCHCLVFCKDNFIWNPDDVQVESDRVAYGDKRIKDSPRGGKRLPGTIWGIPSDGQFWGRVQGNNSERWSKNNGALCDHPNQLPIKYLARLVKAYSNPDSNVLDLFCGSGTMPLTCLALGRRCTSFEISDLSSRSARVRLEKQFKLAKKQVL